MDEKNTQINAYQPSVAETKLLEILSNPEHADKNITEICKLADISRTAYYQIMKRPEFIKFKNDAILNMLQIKSGSLINATYKFATTKANCTSDRKILLTMLGMYTEKTDNTVHGDINANLDLQNYSTEDLKKMLEDKPEEKTE